MQLRYYQAGEILVAAGDRSRRENKAVARRFEPLLHLIGDLCWRTHEDRPLIYSSASRRFNEVANRRVFFAALCDDPVTKAMPGDRGKLLIGKGLFIRPFGEVDVEHLTKKGQRVDRLRQRCGQGSLVLGLAGGFGDYHFDSRRYCHVRRISSGLFDLRLEKGILLAANL